MTAAADLVCYDGEVHPFGTEETYEAFAVRDGRIVSLDSTYEIRFLAGVETREVDLDGGVVLPGFVDAHTHMNTVGRRLVHVDLADADSPADCVSRLREHARGEGWVLGFGFDESTWDDRRFPTREELDEVSERRPVAAFREDMHSVVVNGVALERLGDLPAEDVRTEGGEPTGVLVEDAVGSVHAAIEPDADDLREYLLAAQREAHRLGVTGVHDMVRRSRAPEVYRQLDLDDELRLRVRLNYWSDHLDAAIETGLRTNHGSEFVRVGAIKTFTDGSIGSRTARLAEPYADGENGDRGQWVVPPADLDALVERAHDAGFQIAVHAIGSEAIGATLDAFDAVDAPDERRHRIEHLELATDEQIARIADLGVVASMQPNFHRWAGAGGLYETRLGPERTAASNRLRAFADRNARLAFGSDCMPFDPLYGIHHAVNAPADAQRLSVTEAVRAYTAGAAAAGFDDGRLGTLEPGAAADFVVLDRSPWACPDEIRDIGVAATAVAGDVVYDARGD